MILFCPLTVKEENYMQSDSLITIFCW